VILLHYRKYRGDGDNREDTSNRSYRKQPASITVVKSLRVPPEHTHTHLHPARCLDTSERVACITFSCLSLITCCQNSKSGLYHLTLGSKLIGQNAPHHKPNLLCWPADIHSATRSPQPSSSQRLPATTVAKWMTESSSLLSEQNGR